MATHSSILAWRISGIVEPGGLPSMGSHCRDQLDKQFLKVPYGERMRNKTQEFREK